MREGLVWKFAGNRPLGQPGRICAIGSERMGWKGVNFINLALVNSVIKL
jgi:hypothetical protein